MGCRKGTKKGMLSTLSSVFERIGLVFPFILKGRKTLWKRYSQNVKWHESVSEKILEDWEEWKTRVKQLSNIKVDRRRHFSMQYFSDISDI